MKLWILLPNKKSRKWDPWYDKAFGFVVRAETEGEARALAEARSGDESRNKPTWTDAKCSSCVELTQEGEAGVIMRDFASA